MGLTERHWFENENVPENYEWALEDAVDAAMLKKQELLSIVYLENPFTGLPVAHCPRCGKCVNQFHVGQYGEETHFCPYCGQAVKWNDK